MKTTITAFDITGADLDALFAAAEAGPEALAAASAPLPTFAIVVEDDGPARA